MAAENLFQQYAQPVRSVADYSSDMDAQDLKRQQLVGATRQNALAALVAQQTQQAMAETAADRAALSRAASGWNAQTPAEVRIADLRNSGRAGLMSQADALEKSWLDRRKTDADIGKSAADAAKTGSETIDATLKRYRGHLDYISNPQDAARWMVAQYNDPATAAHMAGAIPIEQAIKNIPQDPQGFQQWRQQAALGMDAYMKQQLEKAKVAETERNNRAGTGLGYSRIAEDKRQFGVTSGLAERKFGYDREKDATKAAAPPKPLPAPALKMQQESLDAIGVASSINADLAGIEKQIGDGKLSFGPVSNAVSSVRNAAGMSSENSRNFASFKSTLERLRNESLRLNAGVQTDGDAQRAWAELFQNISDTELVKQRLGEIQNINKRGTELHRLRVDSVRNNYGAEPLDSAAYSNQPAAVGGSQKPAPAVAKVASDADYNALPSGATFVGPDGKTRRKP